MAERNRLMTRRVVLGAAVLGLGGLAVMGYARYIYNAFDGTELTPPEAHAAAKAGDLILIDIRRPDEWVRTGVPEHATPLDMRRKDFAQALMQITGGDTSRPIALICARGVRSDRMSARLTEAGFTAIRDVPEGMLGSSAGPGWLKRDLPVTQP